LIRPAMLFPRANDRPDGAYFRQACAAGWEGVIAKRADAPYRPGRSRDWLKFKCQSGQEFVIGGFTDPKGARTGFGALLLGYYDPGHRLIYAGKVGAGFSRRTLDSLHATLAGLEQDRPPFDRVVRIPGGARWVAAVPWQDRYWGVTLGRCRLKGLGGSVMDDARLIPLLGAGVPRIDTSLANVARAWNFMVGGKDNFEADRAAASQLMEVAPVIRVAAPASRAFLGRAVRFLAGEAGIRQFLDIGTGLPTAGNTHEVAQLAAPGCRVVYVDNDPVVLTHARALLRARAEIKPVW
jgi:hypothetical protein